jgi:branched-chain amino acid transport system ATP-binding protein
MAGLAVEEITVRFGGVTALGGVDLSAHAGAVTGLIGPNGAGKTTLWNVITGLQRADAGRVLLDGEDISSLRAHERARLGIARTFQRLEMFGSLSVRDNLLVAAEAARVEAPDTLVRDVLERVGLAQLAGARGADLPTGTARLVELGRALAAGPRVLLLDEPSSGLNDEESDRFGDLLLDLAAEGIAVLLVEHDVELVMRVCSYIHVLDFGRIIATGTPAEVRADEAVQAAYLGAEVPT